VGYHDFLAEVDLEALKQRNDRWEVEHRHQSLLDRKTEELLRIAAYVAMRNPPHHIQIHVHAATRPGRRQRKLTRSSTAWVAGPAVRSGRMGWRPGGSRSDLTSQRSNGWWS
jgi:alkylhydroperoxidase/carboxymuconolactone decarboxylase family protein YurZ